MQPVKILCFEDEPKGYFLLWGIQDGETVAIARMEEDGKVVCVSPSSIQFLDLIRVNP